MQSSVGALKQTLTGVAVNNQQLSVPAVDLAASAKTLWCLPGKAILATPHYADRKEGEFELELPDRFTRRLNRRMPAGITLAAHANTGIKPGDIALVDATLAKRVRNVEIGDIRVDREDGEVWLFGCTSPMISTAYPLSPHRYLHAVVRESAEPVQSDTPPAPRHEMQPRYRAVDRHLRLGNHLLQRPWVILKLPTKENIISGLYVPDRVADRDDMAIVEAVSPGCQWVKPGHLVWYQRRALEGLYALGKDFGALPEYAIFAIVNL